MHLIMTSDSRFWQLNKIFYIRNRNDVLFPIANQFKMKKMRQNNLSQTNWAKHWTSIERNTCGKNLLKHFWRPVAQVKHIKKFYQLKNKLIFFFWEIKSIDNNKTIKIMLFCGRAAKQPMKTTRIQKQKKSTMKLYQRAVVYIFVAVDQAYW